MTLHLSREEFAERRRAVRPLPARPLDALPLFQQQSVCWLPRKDTFSYGFFR